MLNIVIAHYKEDFGWIEDVKGIGNLILIHKGGDADIYQKSGVPTYQLRNIGRESHSFLEFIVMTYDYINPEYKYVFLQGNPFDHVTKVELYHNLYMASPNLIGRRFSCDPNGWPHHEGLPINDVCEKLGLGTQSHINFAAGGQFLVTGEQIRSRPKSFYELALKVLFEGSDNHVNPINGFVFERIWRIIFNLNP